jgi:hypothetical protein
LTLVELAKLGRRMREAQRHFFKNRHDRSAFPEALKASKLLEREFDRALESVLEQPTLFDAEGGGD